MCRFSVKNRAVLWLLRSTELCPWAMALHDEIDRLAVGDDCRAAHDHPFAGLNAFGYGDLVADHRTQRDVSKVCDGLSPFVFDDVDGIAVAALGAHDRRQRDDQRRRW